MIRSLLLVALLALIAAAPVAAQGAPRPEPLLRAVARSWADGDANALARRVTDRGLHLEVDGESMGPIEARHVAAALRRVLNGKTTVSVVTTKSALVEGASDRAFGEFTWKHRAEGSAYPETHVLFVGLVREGRDWRVSQIRILP